MAELLLNPEIWGIVALTMRMTLMSTTISALMGIPPGFALERLDFPGKRIIVGINRTLMGTPPVVAGLIFYLLLSRSGPLGFLGLLFTFQAMVIVQVFLITPIICGMVYTAAARNADRIRGFAHTMGADGFQTQVLLVRELGNEIFFSLVTGFGRAMSEVGAIMMVGGNIRFQTRTMTTAIALDVRRGFFAQGLMLGTILMIIAFAVQMAAEFFRKKERQRTDENF